MCEREICLVCAWGDQMFRCNTWLGAKDGKALRERRELEAPRAVGREGQVCERIRVGTGDLPDGGQAGPGNHA